MFATVMREQNSLPVRFMVHRSMRKILAKGLGAGLGGRDKTLASYNTVDGRNPFRIT